MKLVTQIALSLTISASAPAQQTTSDQLISEYLSGRLFVFNDHALNLADSSFFEKLIAGKILKIERLDSVLGRRQYGTIGKNGVLRIQIENLSVLAEEEYRVVDASILKFFDEDRALFYFIGGLPNTNIYYALDILVNKKIKEVKELSPNAAQQIWGSVAKNGAVLINTDGPIDLPMK